MTMSCSEAASRNFAGGKAFSTEACPTAQLETTADTASGLVTYVLTRAAERG
jgi:hypothetical protein